MTPWETTKEVRPNQRTKQHRAKKKKRCPYFFFQQNLNKIRQNPNQNLRRKPPKPKNTRYKCIWDDQRVLSQSENKQHGAKEIETSRPLQQNPNKIRQNPNQTTSRR
jgi:hypothetical protein